MSAVFTYGTLKPDRERWDVLAPYADHLVGIRPAAVQGTLWSTPYGWPALTHGSAWVPGFWVPLHPHAVDEALEVLDTVEGVDCGLFERDRTVTDSGDGCWIYRWPASTHEFVQHDGAW